MKLPQLSLRELFLLVALVAMGCGWAYDRIGCYVGRQHAIEGFEAANEFLGQQERAAAAAGYRFDYQEGKMVMVRTGNKP